MAFNGFMQANIIPLIQEPKTTKKPLKSLAARFRVVPYTNPRTKGKSWRVTGTKRGGLRIRENFSTTEAAQCRQNELEAEWLSKESDTAIRATTLTPDQLRDAERAFAKLE